MVLEPARSLYALSLETSARVGSVALSRDGAVVEERAYPHGLQHATALVPVVDALCRDHGVGPRDLAHVYVSAGPGSFTGLRVGITLAKTLAFATGAKLVAVPSLRVIVENAPIEAMHAVVALDAKRGHVFAARYVRTADGWSEAEPARLDALANVIARSPRPIYLLGEGLPYHRAAIPDDAGVTVTPEDSWRPQAATVARRGGTMADRGEFIDPFKLTPLYLRLPEAEEKRLIAEGKLRSDLGISR